MQIRDHYFKNKMTIADTDTISIDLKGLDPVSALIVEFEVQNGAGGCFDRMIADDVSLIEVADGSEVISALSMKEWLAVCSFVNKRIPRSYITEKPDTVQKQRVILNFGRFIDDSEYWLDTGQFDNPELRIANSFTISDTDGFKTGTAKLTVIGRVIDKGYKKHAGYIATKETKHFTTKSSGDEDINLPLNYPIRCMIDHY